jgi:kinesin family protein 5
MIESVFDYINNSPEDIEFSVKSSFIEIYNEKIHDLLDRKFIIKIARKTNLLIKEEKEKGIWVQDCTEVRNMFIIDICWFF